MASDHSTVLPLDVGRKYRRIYCTMVAAFTALTDLVEASKKSPGIVDRDMVLADALYIHLSNLEAQLDELGVPKSWRAH